MPARSLMRIGVFSPGLPVAGEKRGGIERVAHTLAQGLAERGHRITVFSHDPKPAGAAYDVQPLPWKRFASTWLGRRLTMGYLGNVLALLPDYGAADVLIAHGDSLLLPLKGKPVLRVMHGSALGEALHAMSPGRLTLQMGVYAQELLTAIVTPGTVGVSENTRRDNPFVRHVIPNAVDGRVFHPGAAQKTTHPSVVFVGAESGRKRGRFLLEMFRDVIRPALPDAELFFVGPKGQPREGVTFFTGIDDAQLAGLYQRAWVFASPSTYEGFGLPYLEAMACGTAVIASPNAGSRETIGSTGAGVLAEDAAFAAAMLRVLQDGAARRGLEAAGLARAAEFPLAAMIDRYEALLAQLCGAHVRTASA